jgi:predicted glycosyltransferase
MAAEAAVLGTQAILIGATSRGYVDDIERRYGLIRLFSPDEFDRAIAFATKALAEPRNTTTIEAHQRLISEHIDVTSWLTGHLEERLPSNMI